jgi:hypothetical protein
MLRIERCPAYTFQSSTHISSAELAREAPFAASEAPFIGYVPCTDRSMADDKKYKLVSFKSTFSVIISRVFKVNELRRLIYHRITRGTRQVYSKTCLLNLIVLKVCQSFHFIMNVVVCPPPDLALE